MRTLEDYLRISDAAEYLGVPVTTLRNWQNAGKVVAVRHPVSGYRVFKRKDLDASLTAQRFDPLDSSTYLSRLEEIAVGDKFVAYLPGNKFFALATVIAPRRPKGSGERDEKISGYLKRGKAYTSGHVYFSPSVAYENFTDECDGYPVRIDVDKWDNFVPDGMSVKGPTVPRHKTVYAAFDIDKDRFESIRSGLCGASVKTVIPEEVDSTATYVEGGHDHHRQRLRAKSRSQSEVHRASRIGLRSVRI